jgi:hypothetical protein
MMPLRTISFATLAAVVGLSAGFAVISAASQELSTLQQARTEPNAGERDLNPPLAGPVPSSTLPAAVQSAAGGIWPPDAMTRPNPLWGISLASLKATRERPIFSPSRRPPPVERPAPIQPQPSVSNSEPRRPLLALVGAIAGETDGIAIFVDEKTKDIVRMRTGESLSGWTLSSVKGREATLQKGPETSVLEILLPAGKQEASNPKR